MNKIILLRQKNNYSCRLVLVTENTLKSMSAIYVLAEVLSPINTL